MCIRDSLKDWLTEVAEESDIDSDVVTARSLLSRLENAETRSVFTRQPEPVSYTHLYG